MDRRGEMRRAKRAARKAPFRLRQTDQGPCVFDRGGRLAHRPTTRFGVVTCEHFKKIRTEVDDGWALSAEDVHILLNPPPPQAPPEVTIRERVNTAPIGAGAPNEATSALTTEA